jgi:hypothetical protein
VFAYCEKIRKAEKGNEKPLIPEGAHFQVRVKKYPNVIEDVA